VRLYIKLEWAKSVGVSYDWDFSSYGACRYPTIKLFTKGKIRTYQGARTAAAIYRWLRKKAPEFMSSNKRGLAALWEWLINL